MAVGLLAPQGKFSWLICYSLYIIDRRDLQGSLADFDGIFDRRDLQGFSLIWVQGIVDRRGLQGLSLIMVQSFLLVADSERFHAD